MTNQKPNVLFLTNLPAPYRIPIWNHMADKTNLEVVFTLSEKNWRNWSPPSEVNWRFKFLRLRCFRLGEYEFIPKFYGAGQLLKNTQVAIVSSWEVPIYIHVILKAWHRKIPLAIIYYSHADSQKYKNALIAKIRSWIYNKADFVITFGSYSTSSVKAMGVADQKILSLFNPVDVSWYHSYSTSHRKSEDKGHKYLYVGQLIERKNVESLIQAFSRIRKDSDTLTVVGDGEELIHLKSLAENNGVADVVRFLGQRSSLEIAQVYSQHNTLILPSSNEVWGLVVNEALASGMHVVVSTKCGVTDLIKDMKGYFSCGTDEISIAEAMQNSCSDWQGHIAMPEILEFTPEKWANSVVSRIFAELH
jgi:glycosyltransferase involved in cell wall biosynthesis